jgi:hypothetical protein
MPRMMYGTAWKKERTGEADCAAELVTDGCTKVVVVTVLVVVNLGELESSSAAAAEQKHGSA